MKEITLPSGMTAKIIEGKGLHLLQAQRKAKYPDEVPYALISELTQVEGQTLVLEDILELPLADVTTLLEEVNKTSGESCPPAST